MSDNRIGGWIQTYTGKRIWPLDPREDEIDIEDIAHALSLMCRYTGHVKEFYSVANHSVLVSSILSDRCPQHAFWGLMHDASEAYLHDLPYPLKQDKEFGPIYQRFEDNLMRCVCRKFGMAEVEPPEVELADKDLMATERRDLLVQTEWEWSISNKPLDFHIYPVHPRVAEGLFLDLFEKLCVI